MVRHFDSRLAYSSRLQDDDCVICVYSSRDDRESLHKDQGCWNKDSCRKGKQNSDFRCAYFQLTMVPVHVDTASASAVAAKNIFIESASGGGVAGDACVGFGTSSFGPSGFAPSTSQNLVAGRAPNADRDEHSRSCILPYCSVT